MEKNKLSSAFQGFFELSQIKGEVEDFVNYVKHDLHDERKSVFSTLLVIAQEEEQAILFAQGIITILKEEKLANYYIIRPSFLWDSPIHDEFDCVLVNDFDVQPAETKELKRVAKRLTRTVDNPRLDLVTIFCTTKDRAKQYRDFYKEDYFKFFEKQVELSPYTTQSIITGAHYCFDEWKKRNEIQLKNDFYPALDQWIDTVYDRADKKGKAFVEGLKERLIKQSKILGDPYVFGANTIPHYWHRDSLHIIQEEMNRDEALLWSSEYNDFLTSIKDKVENHAPKKSYNLVILTEAEDIAQRITKFYTRILNSNEYRVTSSKMMEILNVEELLDIDDFEDKHGVVFVKNFDKENTSHAALENMKRISKSLANDLVFVLYCDATKIGKEQNSEDWIHIYLQSLGLEDAFSFCLNLKKHDIESSKKLISYKLQQANVEMSDATSNFCATLLNHKMSLKEAEVFIKEYIDNPDKITKEVEDTDEKKFEMIQECEHALGEVSRLVKSNQKERNVLLLPMSTLNYVNISKYEVDNIAGLIDDSHTGYYVSQMEPVPKILSSLLNNNGAKLDAIYVLNTHESEFQKLKDKEKLKLFTNTKSTIDDEGNEYTAFSYFKERCSQFVDSSRIYSISLENGVESALYEVTKKLQDELKAEFVEKVHLYVDIHGGPRESATVLNAILMLMKDFENIELEDIFTVDYVKPKGRVKSVKEISNVYDFVGGMHEFLSFGRSNGLKKYVQEECVDKDKKIYRKNQALVHAINVFSDGIALNQANVFSENLSRLANKVNGVSYENHFGTVKQLISNNYVVYIDKIEGENGEKIRYDLLSDDKEYLPAQLKWCLDKDLLQQALTLIESVTIESLVNKGIIIYPQETVRDKMNDWINLTLFDSEFRKYLTNDGRLNPNSLYIKKHGVECRLSSDDGISFYRQYNEFFCGISVRHVIKGPQKVIEENKALNDIRTKKTNAIQKRKYYLECNRSTYENCSEGIKKIQRNNVVYYKKDNIPLANTLLNHGTYVDDFYSLLFIHKGLKKYRNTVSHANGEHSRQLSKENLRKWIELYIEVLDKLMRDAKQLLNKS